jgi:hypothetical protein
MMGVFMLMSFVSLIFGVIVGINEASLWTGFLACMMCGTVSLPLAGWWFTPQFPREDEE